jgi:hypothetical protein
MRGAMLVGLGWLAVGCGAGPKLVAARRPVAVEAPVAQERRPYAEELGRSNPIELDGAWLHLSSLRRTFDQLPVLVKSLPGLAPVAQLVAGRGGVLPPDVAAVIDPSQPIDFVWPLGAGANSPALSFRVRSADAVERGLAGLTLTRVAAGVWNIGGLADVEPEQDAGYEDAEVPADDDEAPEDEPSQSEFGSMRCQLIHLPAPQGFRVLCGHGQAPNEYGRAFLLAPARDALAPSDAHLEVAGAGYAALRTIALRSAAARMQAPKSTSQRAGQQVAVDLFDTLLDHDRLSLDVSFSNLRAELQLELSYGAAPSVVGLAQWLERSSRTELPASYARLPTDSMLRLGASLGPNIGDRVLAELEASIDTETLTSAAEKKEMLASLRDILPREGRFSFAMGMDVPAALAALDSPAVRLADDADKPLGPAAMREMQGALGGWTVIGVEEQPARYLAAVKRMYRTRNLRWHARPGYEERNRRSSSELVSLTGAPRGLPRDTLHIVSAERPDRKYTPPADGSKPASLPFDLHVLVVPDGGRVWVVCARSEAVALQRARALLAPAPPLGTATIEAPAVFAASAQLALFALAELDGDSKAQREAARRTLSAVNRAPARGQGSLPVSLQVLPRQDAPGWRLRLRSSAQVDELLAQGIALFPTSE